MIVISLIKEDKLSTLPPKMIKTNKSTTMSDISLLKTELKLISFFIKKELNNVNILQCVYPLKLFPDLENKFRKV